MKNLILISFALLLVSCSMTEINNVLALTDGKPSVKKEFISSKEACEKNNGTFDTETNLCQCILSTPFECAGTGYESRGITTYTSSDRTRELQIFNEAGLLKADVDTFIKSTIIPKVSKSRIYIFKDLAQFKIKNSRNSFYYLNTNFYLPENTSSVETQIYFAPIAKPNLNATGVHLAPILSSILESSFDKSNIEQFLYPKDSKDCLNACYTASLLQDRDNFTFMRLQTFAGGNRVFDTIRVVNKFDNKLDVVLVLFNKKLSHYYKSTGNGYFTVYTNAGEVVDYTASIKEI